MLTNLNPAFSSVMPKSNLGIPSLALTPTVPNKMPASIATIPFEKDLPDTEDTTKRPIRTSVKNSAAENFKATVANMGERKIIPGELVSLREVERDYIRYVLEAVNGNKSMAARILGLDRKTLYRKLGASAGG